MTDTLSSCDDLFCLICKGILKDPHILPCEHTFCKRPCLIPYDETPSCVFCPLCCIEVHPSLIFPNKEIASRLQATFQPHCYAPKFPCTTCLQSCLKLIFCFHCNENICETCLDSHVNILIRFLVQKKKSLLQSRQRLTLVTRSVSPLNDESCKVLRSQLFAEVEQATINLQDACFESLKKATDELETIEVRKNEALLNAFDSLKDFGQILVSMLGQQLDLKKEKDTSHLVLFKNQAKSIMKSVNGISNLLSSTDAGILKDFCVSRSFETIHTLLESLNLIVPENILLSSFGDDTARKNSSPSSLDLESAGNNLSGDTFPESSYANGDKELGNRTVFIGGLNQLLNVAKISDYFSKFGSVVNVCIPNSSKTKLRLGFGFVTFSEKYAAELAIESKTHYIGDLRVDVRKYRADLYSERRILPSKKSGEDGIFFNSTSGLAL